jgi:AcrR family transcriptional regulator
VSKAPAITIARRRSASSQENDERLLDAALDEIACVGIDRLGMSSVARRAGLTTGALYGRYENVNELAADVWTTRVRDAQFQFLDHAVRRLVDGDVSIAVADVVRELSVPTRATIAALELLATARRIDELGWIFYDRSRNQSARWCAMNVCGDRDKARAYYRRKTLDREL